MHRRTFLVSLGAWALAACDGSGGKPPPSPSPATSPPATATSSPAPTATSTATPPPATRPATPAARLDPTGFPIDPTTRLGLVTGEPGNRTIEWGAGPTPHA